MQARWSSGLGTRGDTPPDVLGYARIFTSDQDLEVQRRRLREEAGAIKVFDDIISGKHFDRPGLTETLEFCRAGDTICVVRLDRLAPPLKKLLETIDMFKARGLAFRSLEERWIRHRLPGSWCFMLVPSRTSSAG